MKHLSIYMACLLVFALNSCKTLDKLTRFNMNFRTEFTIESNAGINLPFNLISPEMQTNAQSTFENEETRSDLVEEIRLTSLRLELQSPSDGSFSFLNEVEIFIQAEGLDDKRLAFKENIPSTIGKVLELDVSGQDFQAYIKKEEFSLRLEVITDEVITRDHELVAFSGYEVKAQLLN